MNQTETGPVWLTMATVKDGVLITAQRLYWEDKLREEIGPMFDLEYGPENWLITPTEELPEGYDPATYTIENGQFAPASAEMLAVRAEVENARKAEALRAKRDGLLAATDKYLILDFPISKAQHEQYLLYRQYLRDLPESEGFPDVTVKSFGEFAGTE